MSAPYKAWGDWWGDSEYVECVTLAEAIEAARRMDEAGCPSVRVLGDGYDCDCDEDGFFESSDGLTDEEREQVEEAFRTVKTLARLRGAIEARERAYAVHREACKATPFDIEHAARAERDWAENVRKVEEEMWDAFEAREA